MSKYVCPECDKMNNIYDTRAQGTILKRRRKCPNGHRLTTFEIHGSSLEKLNELIDWTFGENTDLDPDMIDYFKTKSRNILLGVEEEDDE